MRIVKQRHAVEHGGVINKDLVDLLVNSALCACGVQAGDLGYKADIVVDERLTRHGELPAVGVDLTLRQKLGRRLVGLQLAVFADAEKVACAAGKVAVILGRLEVGNAALSGPKLERGRNGLIQLDDVFPDSVIKNRRECRSGVKELAANGVEKIVLAHTQQRGGSAYAVTRKAFDSHVAQ